MQVTVPTYLVARFGVLSNPKPAFQARPRESIIWQRRRNDIECRFPVTSLEHRQHLCHFQKASWPAMAEEQRNSAFDITFLMQEMHVDISKSIYVNRRLKLRECLIHPFLVFSPVKIVLPMIVEALYISSVEQVNTLAKLGSRSGSFHPMSYFGEP